MNESFAGTRLDSNSLLQQAWTMSLRNRTVPWPIRGVIAGFAGTAAMTAVYSYLHASRPGAVGVPDAEGLGGQAGLDYDDSAVPGQIAATILHLPSVTVKQASELTLAIRWSYGSAFGVAHVLLRSRFSEPVPTLIFGSALMTITFSMFPILGRTPPPWRWTADAMVTSVVTHVAYISTAAITDDLLRGRNTALYNLQD